MTKLWEIKQTKQRDIHVVKTHCFLKAYFGPFINSHDGTCSSVFLCKVNSYWGLSKNSLKVTCLLGHASGKRIIHKKIQVNTTLEIINTYSRIVRITEERLEVQGCWIKMNWVRCVGQIKRKQKLEKNQLGWNGRDDVNNHKKYPCEHQ